MKRLKAISAYLATGLSSLALVVAPVAAATNVVVTPDNPEGWSSTTPIADTRPGGEVKIISDESAPGGEGALQLTTDATTTSKAQYMHQAGNTLASVSELSYHTKQNTASSEGGAPSYQLAVCLGGLSNPTDPATCTGFTTLVYEPYQNGTVVPDDWQQWDVDAGQFWSSRGYTAGDCTVAAGGGGAPFYTLEALKTACPNAIVAAYGVNIGSNNPSYNVLTDLFNFNGTIYDFEVTEPAQQPTNKEECKNDGWRAGIADRQFKNQGDCVSHFASEKRANEGNPVVNFFKSIFNR